MNEVWFVVIDRQGQAHRIKGPSGWSIMEAIKAASAPALSLKAECGGACACATCHVYLDPSQPEVSQANEEEQFCLDQALAVKANSRLSCQLLLDPSQNELTVTLTPATEE